MSIRTTTVPKLVIITPVRDEESHLGKTIESVVRQSLVPREWIIVNDGSSDGTGAIIDAAAAQIPWLKGVHRRDRGRRKSGGGVVEAFNDGLQSLQSTDWEFLVKLDGDLSFDADYFERALKHFEDDSTLGIGGGTIYNIIGGCLVMESCPRFHVRGATKIYRRACWETLGGLLSAPGWDTLDEVRAQMKGWTTKSFPELPLTHHRLTGAADGMWGGYVKNGRANYICGYHPLFMTAKCITRLFRRPYVLASVALAYGFIGGYTMGLSQVSDKQLIRYLRGQQLARLVGGRSIWN